MPRYINTNTTIFLVVGAAASLYILGFVFFLLPPHLATLYSYVSGKEMIRGTHVHEPTTILSPGSEDSLENECSTWLEQSTV